MQSIFLDLLRDTHVALIGIRLNHVCHLRVSAIPSPHRLLGIIRAVIARIVVVFTAWIHISVLGSFSNRIDSLRVASISIVVETNVIKLDPKKILGEGKTLVLEMGSFVNSELEYLVQTFVATWMEIVDVAFNSCLTVCESNIRWKPLEAIGSYPKV